MKLLRLAPLVLALALGGCASAPSPRMARAPKTTITVLAGQSTSDAGIEDMIDQALDDALPDVQLEWECVDWGDQFAPQIAIKVAAGELPDLLIGKAQDVTTYARSGLLAPLDGEYVSRVPEAALAVATVGGAAYGVPYNALYQGVFYNKAIFERLNLAPPATLDALHEAVRRLNEAGVTPFATHNQDVWSIANMLMQFAVNDLFAGDARFGDRVRDGEAAFSESAAYAHCLAQLKYVNDNTWPDTFSVGQAECDERFARGEAAMYVTGTWSLQQMMEVAPEADVGVFPYPNRSGDARLIFEPNLTLMVSARTREREVVEQVLAALFKDEELAARISTYTQTVPLMKGVTTRFQNAVQDDIDAYSRADRIVDVSIGNTQLVWTFQEALAQQAARYLAGECSLDDVLGWADENALK